MTIEFKMLTDYRKEGQQRAERLSVYQTAVKDVKALISELTAHYELTFTEAIKNGKDETVELAAIDARISELRAQVVRLERDRNLAQAAMPQGTISPVAVVEEFREYTKQVQALHVPGIEARLTLARDLIISAMQDAKELDVEYSAVTEEVKEISKSNHSSGLTSAWMGVSHPLRAARILRRQGTTNAVQAVLENVRDYSEGMTVNFDYVAEAPTTKKAK